MLIEQFKEVNHDLGISVFSLHYPQQIAQSSSHHYQIQTGSRMVARLKKPNSVLQMATSFYH